MFEIGWAILNLREQGWDELDFKLLAGDKYILSDWLFYQDFEHVEYVFLYSAWDDFGIFRHF